MGRRRKLERLRRRIERRVKGFLFRALDELTRKMMDPDPKKSKKRKDTQADDAGSLESRPKN